MLCEFVEREEANAKECNVRGEEGQIDLLRLRGYFFLSGERVGREEIGICVIDQHPASLDLPTFTLKLPSFSASWLEGEFAAASTESHISV